MSWKYCIQTVVLITIALAHSNVKAQNDNDNDKKSLIIRPEHAESSEFSVKYKGKISTVKEACMNYASDSVEQNEWQTAQRCGYKSNSWNSDFQYHYNWCIDKNNTNEISTQIRNRQEKIASCICNPYAKEAVNQNKFNIELACRFSGTRWSSNFQHHYNWCAQGGGDIIKSGSWKSFKTWRDREIAKCKDDYCDDYAVASVEQNNQNKKKKCGFRNSRWNSDYSHHFNWCIGGGWKNSIDELQYRTKFLSEECKPTKKPPTSSSPGMLAGAFYFEASSGTQQFEITVKFKGTFESKGEMVGDKSFSIEKKKTMYPTTAGTIGFKADGLAKGKWKVRASSNMTGSVTCVANVPGYVKLNVKGSPSCN